MYNLTFSGGATGVRAVADGNVEKAQEVAAGATGSISCTGKIELLVLGDSKPLDTETPGGGAPS